MALNLSAFENPCFHGNPAIASTGRKPAIDDKIFAVVSIFLGATWAYIYFKIEILRLRGCQSEIEMMGLHVAGVRDIQSEEIS
jgi:hypothetical protein